MHPGSIFRSAAREGRRNLNRNAVTALLRSIEGRRTDLSLTDNGDLEGRVIVTYTGLEAAWHRHQVGSWYLNLTQGRREASSDLKQAVASPTAVSPTTLAKMQVIANFAQHDIRYVAI